MCKKERCCGCLCPRKYGVLIVPPYMVLSLFVIGMQMAGWGMRAVPWVSPVLAMILIMAVISATVMYIPQCQTNCGRYLVFFWWFTFITWAWNIIWWVMIFNDIDGQNANQW